MTNVVIQAPALSAVVIGLFAAHAAILLSSPLDAVFRSTLLVAPVFKVSGGGKFLALIIGVPTAASAAICCPSPEVPSQVDVDQ